jgi:hypothetical protein
VKRLATLIAFVLVAAGVAASPAAVADDPATGSIVGVVDGDPSAVATATVYLSPGPGEDEGRTTPVASDGSYRFDGLATAQYIVRVGGAGTTWTPDFWTSVFQWYSTTTITVVAGRVATAPDQHVFRTENIGHIDIVDPDNNQGEYSVWAADDPDRAVIAESVATNGDISYFPIAPGRYKIQGPNGGWFGGTSFASAAVHVVEPGKTLTVTTPPLKRYGLRVTAPTEGVWIMAYSADDPTEIVQQGTTNIYREVNFNGFNLDGRYKFRAVDPSGRFTSAWFGGDTFDTATAVEPDFGPFADTPTIRMERADGVPPYTWPPEDVLRGTVKGMVSGPGLNRNRFGMTLVDAANRDAELYETRFMDDDTYEFESVAPGDYKMLIDDGVFVGGRSFQSATVFHVEPGQTVTRDVVYPESRFLRAQVLNPNGRPIPGLMIEVHTGTGADEVVMRRTVGQYGYLGRLPIQPYKLRIVDPGERYAESWVGGGTSRESADAFTPATEPREDDVTNVPDTILRPILRPLLAPVIDGGTTDGQTIVATTQGTWSMSGLELRGQWLRDGSPIPGETGSSYRLRPADVGRRVFYRVTASKDGQPTRVAESRRVTVAAAPADAPSVVPAPRVGKMSLTAGRGRHASKLRVKISAPGVSPSTVRGTVTVRDRHGARRVSAVMRRGAVTISLRRIKNGARTLDVSFKASSSMVVPQRSIRLRVR